MPHFSNAPNRASPRRTFRAAFTVLALLQEAIARHGPPEHIRSDNGPEFIAKEVQEWFRELGIRTIYTDPGSPWQNGHVESFHNRLRDECLNREILLSLTEAKVLIEQWRQFYNREHPHSRLGLQSPDEFARNQTRPVLGCAPASPPLHPSLNPTT